MIHFVITSIKIPLGEKKPFLFENAMLEHFLQPQLDFYYIFKHFKFGHSVH